MYHRFNVSHNILYMLGNKLEQFERLSNISCNICYVTFQCFGYHQKQPANQRKQTKMAERKVAAALIAILIFDDDETKRRGKTRSWIKRRK